MRKARLNTGGDLTAALDVGTTKVCCFIARRGEDGRPQVIGIGHQLARGLRGGAIIDMEAAGPVRNLSTCIARCHLDIRSLVVSPYAAGLASLVDDEMDLGVCVVDMGGGTTTLAVFFDGNVVYTDSIPIGGQHVTSDIARG